MYRILPEISANGFSSHPVSYGVEQFTAMAVNRAVSSHTCGMPSVSWSPSRRSSFSLMRNGRFGLATPAARCLSEGSAVGQSLVSSGMRTIWTSRRLRPDSSWVPRAKGVTVWPVALANSAARGAARSTSCCWMVMEITENGTLSDILQTALPPHSERQVFRRLPPDVLKSPQ